MDNCYLGIDEYNADMTLGCPSDTAGDGICTTNSTNWLPRFGLIDGVVNPRGTPEWTGIDKKETDILPTTSKYLVLNDNYPNPFNPETTIEFEVGKDTALLSLKIYNSKGQLVRTLIDKKIYQKGKFSIIWKGDNNKGEEVPSGAYFYKLISNSRMQIKKAILVK